MSNTYHHRGPKRRMDKDNKDDKKLYYRRYRRRVKKFMDRQDWESIPKFRKTHGWLTWQDKQIGDCTWLEPGRGNTLGGSTPSPTAKMKQVNCAGHNTDWKSVGTFAGVWFDSIAYCQGRISKLGLALIRNQRAPQGVGFDSSFYR